MHNKLVRATAMTLLFVALATPVSAHGNDNNKEAKSIKKEFQAEIKLLKKELKAELKNARKEDDDDDEDEKRTALSVCLQTAAKAHVQALNAARSTREAALKTAKKTYEQALRDAQRIRKDANESARATFRASDKGIEAEVALETALYNATVTWLRAKHAAKTAWETVKTSAETTWKTAKAAADAAYAAAKEQCRAATPPTTPPVADTTAPSATTLSLSGATSGSLVLGWTAPGDDAATGTAAAYDIRYSTSPIATAADFSAATQVSGEPTPAVAGTSQSMTVSGLTAATTYHFAMKSQDEVPNVSAMSNVVSLATLALADTTAPGAITTLTLSAPTATSLTAAWMAPGDDGVTGTAASYDLRYATTLIVTAADFAAATQVTGEPTPAVAGTTQSMSVSGLTTGATYFFAMTAQDEVPNVSAMSNVSSLSTL